MEKDLKLKRMSEVELQEVGWLWKTYIDLEASKGSKREAEYRLHKQLDKYNRPARHDDSRRARAKQSCQYAGRGIPSRMA